MLANTQNLLSNLRDIAQSNALLLLTIMGGALVVNLINWTLGGVLNIFGIIPRHILGLPGIFLSAILHADFNHFFFNALPFFILANLVLLEGSTFLFYLTFTILLLSGISIWLFGRRACHIGASTLIMGYFGYLLLQAYFHPSLLAIVLAFICLYYLGGLFMSLLPEEEGVSWEGHVFGFLAGIATHVALPWLLQYNLLQPVYRLFFNAMPAISWLA